LQKGIWSWLVASLLHFLIIGKGSLAPTAFGHCIDNPLEINSTTINSKSEESNEMNLSKVFLTFSNKFAIASQSFRFSA
jgi:hypothetical protein